MAIRLQALKQAMCVIPLWRMFRENLRKLAFIGDRDHIKARQNLCRRNKTWMVIMRDLTREQSHFWS